MCQDKFRVKLDLSKFYKDVRRFCWIFVNGSKMLQIVHVKEHISKLFNIKPPFDLLLNEKEYLPPNEDIRILKNNETILVSPGSGLEDETQLPTENATEGKSNFVKQNTERTPVQNKHSQANILPQLNSIEVQTVPNEILNNSQTEIVEQDTQFHGRRNSEVSSVENSKSLISLTEFFNSTELHPKRKRHRNRKKRTQVEQHVVQEGESKPKKPKIISSCMLTGTHIRFDNLGTEEIKGHQTIEAETNGTSVKQVPPIRELDTLLSLGQNSYPPTFTNKRENKEIKVEQMSEEEDQVNTTSKNVNGNATINEKLSNGKDFECDLVNCPVMTTKPQTSDIIGFKMLKIGSDYTPQVSNYIVAEVLSCCPNTSTYTFKILKGMSEVQVPVGKFTLIQNEEEHVMDNAITINGAQMIEPKLIFSSKATIPDPVTT